MTETDRQLPTGDEIFLDHVGHFVRDPKAAADALARAGFAPTPQSVQVAPDGSPTGTGNVCAMFARGYVEVLFRTADTPLGREFEAALARHAGLQLAAFAVADAAAWHGGLGRAGFQRRPLARFSRPVGTATGTATAAFTVARVEPGEMAEGRIQMLTHHSEDAVWQPRWLDHPNGALGLASLVIVATHVEEAAARFSRFTSRPAAQTRAGQAIRLNRGRIDIITREFFTAMLPEIDVPSPPFIAAYGVTVKSLDAAGEILRNGALPFRRAADWLVAPFPDDLGKGAWLFSESREASTFA